MIIRLNYILKMVKEFSDILFHHEIFIILILFYQKQCKTVNGSFNTELLFLLFFKVFQKYILGRYK